MGTGKIFLLTAAFKEDTNICSVLNLDMAPVFRLCLWLYNKALIDQLVRFIREIFEPQLFVRTSLHSDRSEVRTKNFGPNIFSYGPN